MIDLKRETENLAYKPDWDFTTEKFAGRDILIIRASVLHSETLKPVTFLIRRIIPSVAMLSVPVFLSWVQDMLAEAEFHELREFFRYRDKLVDSPHATLEEQ